MEDAREQEAKWKRLQEVLCAEAQGKPVHAISSKKSLFGIESSVEAQMRRLMRDSDPEGDTRRSVLLDALVPLAEAEGQRLIVGRADRYFVHVGRSLGYDIPSCPFDPAGELRLFLAEQGACDLPDWYRARGIDVSFDVLGGRALIAHRGKGEAAWRVALASGSELVDSTRFVPLVQSGLLEDASFQVLESIRSAFAELGLLNI